MSKPVLQNLPAFVVALLLPCTACAQSQDHDTALKPPLLAPMPDNSTWTVSVTNSATAATLPPGAKVVNQFINTKSGHNRHLVAMWTDGSTSQIWFWQGYRLDQNPGSSEILVTREQGGYDAQDADFFDLNWLGLSNYVGLEDENGRSCYHFNMQVKLQRPSAAMGGPPVVTNYSAYLEVKTKRPVAWDAGPNHFELTSFSLLKADSPLVLPDAFAAQLKANRLAAKLTDPYKKR